MVLLTLATGHTISGQSLRYPLSAPGIGLGAYSRLNPDPLAFTGNQAALAGVKQPGLGLYGERRFMLAELGFYMAGLVLPTRMGNIGLQLNYAGFPGFNEKKIGLAYGRALGKKLDIGIQFNYYNYKIPAYKGASAITAEAGVLLHLTPRVQAGLHCYNPVGGKLGKDKNEKLPSAYKFGLGYDVSDHLFMAMEAQKEEDKPVNITAGLQYQYSRKFTAKLGVMTASSTWFGGIGFRFSKLQVLVSVSYSGGLGFSPGMLLTYYTKNNEL